MPKFVKAQEPFRFYTRLHLSEVTGFRAATLEQLVSLIKGVPGASIYHHTHRFLQQHQYLSPEPPNDFAYWISHGLGEEELAERLASIDTVQFSTIRALRNKIARTIDDYLEEYPSAKLKFTRSDEEFYFIKSISFALPTKYNATDLGEFLDILKKVTIDSIYFHVFESRLRLEKETNDFSYWMETSLGKKACADEIARLDPYTYTLEDLRKAIIKIIEKKGSVYVDH
ncbi:MAG: DUF5752 family protein [Candidatus Omnitrophota bacterium]